jgi:hypothetical protein
MGCNPMKALALLLLPVLVLGRAPIRLKQYPVAARALTQFQANSSIFNGTGGSSTSNTNNPWAGAQSNLLTAGPSSTVIFSQTVSPAANICNDSFVKVTFRIDNKNNVVNHNRLDLYLLNDASNFITYEFGSFGIRDTNLTYWGEWAQYNVSLKKFVQTGAFNCASVNLAAVGLRAQTGTQDSITMGEIAVFPRRNPIATVVWNEDDQWDSWRRNGASVLDSVCQDYTESLNGSRAGVTNFSSEVQLDSMFFRSACSKPDFGPHLWAHDSITDYTVDSALGSIRHSQDWIRGHGWCQPGRCAVRYLALPYGKKARPIDSVLRHSDLVDAIRLTKGAGDGESQQWNDIYAMRVVTSLGNNIDTTAAKQIVDTLIAHKTIGIFLIHQIGAVGCTEDANTWCADHWLSLVRYVQTKVAAGTLKVKRISDVLQQYGGGVGPGRRAGIGR